MLRASFVLQNQGLYIILLIMGAVRAAGRLFYIEWRKCMYKNYLFDLYGTLVDINTDEWCDEIWDRMALIYTLSGAPYTGKELHENYDRLVQEEKKKIPKSKYTTTPEPLVENVFITLYEQKGVSCDRETATYTGRVFRALSIKFIRLYDGVHELFKAIRDNGGRIFLLSNAQRIFTEPEIRMLGIYDEFDYVMISSDEGVAKPDRKFYECMLNRFDLDPKETIMIGNDYITDIKGSYEAGIDSLYLDTDISPEIKGELLAKYKIMSGSLIEARKVLFGE